MRVRARVRVRVRARSRVRFRLRFRVRVRVRRVEEAALRDHLSEAHRAWLWLCLGLVLG